MCSSRSANVPNRVVLPSDVKPTHYRVRLEPDLEKFTFSGEVEISLDVATATNQVAVNILDLTIHSAEINGEKASESKHDGDAQSMTWTFPSQLVAGSQAKLKVAFDGTLNDQLAGFYRSVHKDENGKQQVVATTQMEATDCRRAFPCFDEPALKATFDIEMVADKKYTVLSNSDVKKTSELPSGKVLTQFNTTPKMSTYLVAFIVGELNYVESNDFRVPVRVYGTPGLEKKGQFSADLAAKTLKFFEETFGIEYPMPKCDMVGIHDFSAGAMENWGLITYRNVDVFFEEGVDSLSTKIRVAEVVQHELAHQWFGNLVTMEWWDGLWLNEGFATWMSWYSCNHFFPEWKVWESYVSKQLQGCLDLDGLRSSHPIQVPVKRADEIAQIFDAISYLKGSCVIKMISQFLGEDIFIKGIALYLKRHQYGNTTTDDLWNALAEVSGKDVKGQMDIWTRKVGYPLVTVEESGNELTLTQNRYLRTADVKPEENETVYPVVLGVRSANGKVDHTKVLSERTGKITIDGDFYKLNADQSSIYRVHYPTDRLLKLAEEGAKPHSRLSVEDRVGLVTDLGALAGAYVPTSQLLTLIWTWKNEQESTVWTSILSNIARIRQAWKFESAEVRDAFTKYREAVIVPMAKQVGHEFSASDSAQVASLKADLFAAAVGTGNKEFVDTALALYSKGVTNINANIRPTVFRAVAEYGTTAQWNELLEIYTSGAYGATGNEALSSLGSTKDMALRQKALDFILDGTVRTQDSYRAIGGVAHDAAGQELAWKWLQTKYDDLIKTFPPGLNLLSHIISSATAGFTKQEQLSDIEKFFSGRDLKGIDQALNIAKDRVRASINWLGKDAGDVKDWLVKHQFL